MRRRQFIGLIGAMAMVPFQRVRAQPSAIPVVGFLRSTSASGSMHLVDAFRNGLQEAGFVEGQNVILEYRWADNRQDVLPELAADLVRRQVAVIVGNAAAVQAAMAATTATPIVFVAGVDPVKTGLVPSLNRPDRNVTGVIFDTIELAAKRLGLLHELVPQAATVAMLLDSTLPSFETELRDAEAATRAVGLELLVVRATNEREITAAFDTFANAGAHTLLVGSGPVFLSQRRELVTLAARYRLPASFVTRDYAEVGGLMTYGPSQTDAYRRGGIYVGRILKGAKPSDLPVEQPTKFELVINLKTAKELGLTIPPTLLARADEVIE